VTGWSFANVIVKITHAPAVTFAFWRLWVGAGVMLLVLLGTGRRVTLSMMKASAPGGVLFGLNILMFFSAIRATSIADVQVIQALQPTLILLVASPLFSERITRHQVQWTAVSVGGVVLVTIGSSGSPVWSLRGDVFAVGSLLVWTAYFLVSKRVRRDVPAIEYMTTVTVVAALVTTPIALLSRQPMASLRWQDWAWLGLFVVAAQGGHLMLAWAHAQVDVTISSLLILGQPIISSGAALVVLGEALTPLEIAGGLVVVASVAAIVSRATRAGGGEETATPETLPA